MRDKPWGTLQGGGEPPYPGRPVSCKHRRGAQLGGRRAFCRNQRQTHEQSRPSALKRRLDRGGLRNHEPLAATGGVLVSSEGPEAAKRLLPHEAELDEPQARLPNPPQVSLVLLLILFLGTVIIPCLLSTCIDRLRYLCSTSVLRTAPYSHFADEGAEAGKEASVAGQAARGHQSQGQSGASCFSALVPGL